MVSINFSWKIPLNFNECVTNARIKSTFFGYQNNFDYLVLCALEKMKTHFVHLVFGKNKVTRATHANPQPSVNKEKPTAFDLEQFLRNEAISLKSCSQSNIWDVLSNFHSIKVHNVFFFTFGYIFSLKKILWQTLEHEPFFELIDSDTNCNWYSLCLCTLISTRVVNGFCYF